jgi:hypothetical protein
VAGIDNRVLGARSELPPIVGVHLTFSGDAETLARSGPRPHFSVVVPSCEPESVWPSANACEKVALMEANKVVRADIDNGSLIDFSFGDHLSFD